jgi:hypothetical protein
MKGVPSDGDLATREQIRAATKARAAQIAIRTVTEAQSAIFNLELVDDTLGGLLHAELSDVLARLKSKYPA